jgi:hypothetical protein
MKRSNSQMDGIPKPRGKPGPKKKLKVYVQPLARDCDPLTASAATASTAPSCPSRRPS